MPNALELSAYLMKGSVEILNKIFGSPYRVKIFRFFILNPESPVQLKELGGKLNLNSNIIRREVLVLFRVGFIKPVRKNKSEKWILNSSFLFLKPLRNLILFASPVSKEDLLERIRKIGRCKLVILSGVLIQEDNDSKIDLLIIGDNLSKGMFTKILKGIQADAGREISYVLMSVKDFRYRLDIRDKFVREILESPHEVILDRLKIF